MTIVRKSLTDAKPLTRAGKTRLKAVLDADINTDDIPELDDLFWRNAKLVHPVPKKQTTIRFDQDILEWFQAQGKGYQSRMNAVLRAYVEARRSE